MDDSILNSVKTKLNIEPENTEFDNDIIDYVNSAFGVLHQLGVGPLMGFEIEDNSATWTSFTGGDARLNPAKTFVAKKVQQVFDLPATGPAQAALQEVINELTFRLNVVREEVIYGAPLYPNDSGSLPAEGTVLDGGKP